MANSHNVAKVSMLLALVVHSVVSQAADSESDFQKIKIEDRLPYGQQPIDYHGQAVSDAVARLNRRLDSDNENLTFRDAHGYLLSLLNALKVPVESQVLVYSKTAVNQRLIGPKTPRAIYFSDQVYVAWVPETLELEVAALDPQKGFVFYVLSNRKPDSDARPILTRTSRCLACHAGNTTMQIPGLMVRSFQTDLRGKPISGYSRVTHATPVKNRWGGWYVTGRHGKQTHLGNLIGEKDNDRHKRDPKYRGNVTDLSKFFDVSLYPSRHSDLVAHLVLNHQIHGQNLLIRVNHEARLKRRSDAEDQLIRYLFFADEARLEAAVRGTTKFASWFERQSVVDSQQRSLRQFDLKSRIFKFRLSYLIYSELFRELPSAAKSRIVKRIENILRGGNPTDEFKRIPQSERDAILAILKSATDDFSFLVK